MPLVHLGLCCEDREAVEQLVGEERRRRPECLRWSGMCVAPLLTVHIRDTHLHTNNNHYLLLVETQRQPDPPTDELSATSSSQITESSA